MKNIAALCYTLCFTGCVASPSTEHEENVYNIKSSLSLPSDASSQAKSAAVETLNSILPDWDPSVLKSNSSPSKEGPPFERPREIAQLVSAKPLEFKEKRANGREVFQDKEQKLKIKSDEARGYWSMIGQFPSVEEIREDDISKLSLADVESHARDFFDKLNLPTEQMGDVITDYLMGSVGDEKAKVVARHVRIKRIVNGYRVMGSRLMFHYKADGTPFHIEVRWPKFVMEQNINILSREKVIDELSDELARYFEKRRPVEVLSSLDYHFDEDKGTHHPVISVWTFVESMYSSPVLLEYSLVHGLKKGSKEPSVDI